MAVTFESYERRIDQIKPVMEKYGIKDFEDALKICTDKGFNPYEIVKGVQPICFENAAWAYTLGAAIAIKKGCTKAADAAKAIGEGLQAFCIPGSVADDRKVGLGHGNLASMLLSEDTKCFAFLAGHESFAAAEGAIGIAKSANKVRKEPLRVILNGLRKRCSTSNIKNKWIYICKNRLRLLHRKSKHCRRNKIFRWRKKSSKMLWS